MDGGTRGHLERWKALVRARREQMDAQMAALGGPPEDWWAGRGRGLARGIGEPAAAPPSGLVGIADRLDRSDTLLDVGGGAGRYAIPLSRVLRHVTLLEPSPWMLDEARQFVAREDRANVSLIEGGWPDTAVEQHSAVLLANVLSPYEELDVWISRALEVAGEWLFIVHGTGSDTAEPMQEVATALHGQPRVRQPELADLIPALHELGVMPDVLMGERRFPRVFESRQHAVREAAALALVEPTVDVRRRIAAILRPHLQAHPSGGVTLPEVVGPVALLAWRIPHDGRRATSGRRTGEASRR